MTEPGDPSARSRKSRPTTYLAIGAVVIAVAVLSVLAATGALAPKASHDQPSGRTLATAGSTYGIALGQYSTIGFHLNSQSTLSGSFVTTQGVVAYAMDTLSFLAFAKNGSTTGAAWHQGNESSGTFDLTLPPGDWSFVMEPSGTIWGTTVDFTTNFVASPG
jgi:hypothetical protein